MSSAARRMPSRSPGVGGRPRAGRATDGAAAAKGAIYIPDPSVTKGHPRDGVKVRRALGAPDAEQLPHRGRDASEEPELPAELADLGERGQGLLPVAGVAAVGLVDH